MLRLTQALLPLCLGASLAVAAQEYLPAPPAGDAELVISSGIEGGGYWSAGTRLEAVATAMGMTVANRTSTGSLDNLDQLLRGDGSVNLAFAQADAMRHYLRDHPDAEQKLEVLENIGQECVFILTDRNSPVHSDEDLQAAKNLRLGIGSPDSGIAVTFDYMASLVPELAGIEVSYGDTLAMMDELSTPDVGVDAVMLVHRPKEHSPEVDRALAQPERYRFLSIADERLTAELPGGQRVYRGMRIAMPGAVQGAEPVNTICVRGLLLANKTRLAADSRDKLSELMDYHWMRVYATPQ